MNTPTLMSLLPDAALTGVTPDLQTRVDDASLAQITQAWRWACEQGAAALVPLLRPHVTWTQDQADALREAIHRGHTDLVAAVFTLPPDEDEPRGTLAHRGEWLATAIQRDDPTMVRLLIEGQPAREIDGRAEVLGLGLIEAIGHHRLERVQQIWAHLEKHPPEESLLKDPFLLEEEQRADLVSALPALASPEMIAWVFAHSLRPTEPAHGALSQGETHLAWLEGLRGDLPQFPSWSSVIAAIPADELNPLLQVFHQMSGWGAVDPLLPHCPEPIQEAWLNSAGAILPLTQAARQARGRAAELAQRPAAPTRHRHRS